MSNLTKLKLNAGQRLDVEDVDTLVNSIKADAKYFTSRMLSPNPIIVNGFTIASSWVGQSSLQVVVAGGLLLNAGGSTDVAWWSPAIGATPLALGISTTGLQIGRNYLELELGYVEGTPLQRAFWNPSAASGAGLEFNQEVNTVSELFASVKVNQVGFTGSLNRVPLAIVDLSAGLLITGILDRRELFFRLGSANNSLNSYSWASRVEPSVTLTFTTPSLTAFIAGETITFAAGATSTVLVGGTNSVQVIDLSSNSISAGGLVSGGTSGATATLASFSEDFSGADKSITNQDDWQSAVMTEIKAMKGTKHWYEPGNVISLPRLLAYVHAFITPVSAFGNSRVFWSGSALSFTDNRSSGWTTLDPIAAIRVPGDAGELILTRQDSLGGSAPIGIPDGGLLYVELPATGASRNFSEAGPGVTNFRVALRADFVATDTNFVLGYREGVNFIFRGMGELEPNQSAQIGDGVANETLAFIGATSESDSSPDYSTVPSALLPATFTTANNLVEAISVLALNQNRLALRSLEVYTEKVTFATLTAPATAITLPLDSAQGNTAQTFTPGTDTLEVYLNGALLTVGEDYTENGLGTGIITLDTYDIGDVLTFVMRTPQTFL